jgi:hypothetical protein
MICVIIDWDHGLKFRNNLYFLHFPDNQAIAPNVFAENYLTRLRQAAPILVQIESIGFKRFLCRKIFIFSAFAPKLVRPGVEGSSPG